MMPSSVGLAIGVIVEVGLGFCVMGFVVLVDLP